ncbi:MAG: competence protein ComEC [Planctomycetota bacterium]
MDADERAAELSAGPGNRPLEPLAACLAAGAWLGIWASKCALFWTLGVLLGLALLVRARAPRAWYLPLLILTLLATGRSARPSDQVSAPGRWLPRRTQSQHLEGRLAESPTRLRLGPGSAAAGETIQLQQTHPRLAAAMPGAEARTVRLESQRDEVLRLLPTARFWPRPWSEGLTRWRQAGIRRLQRLRDERLAGLLPALVFGDRSELDPGLSDLFTRTGTRHLLALSGLHVVLAAGLFAWPLGAACRALVQALARGSARSRVGLGRWTEALVRAAIVLAFLPLGGGGAPVARASLAACLVALAPVLDRRPLPRGSGRRVDGRSLWCIALIVELLANPAALEQLGVQLSYAATLGLLCVLGPARRRFYARWPEFGQLGRVGRTGLARPASLGALYGRLLRGFLDALLASCVACSCTLPLAWIYFGEFAPTGLLATPLAVPCIAWLLGAGAVHACTPLLVPETWLLLPMEWLLHGLAAFDSLPGTPWVLPLRAPWQVLATLGLGLAWVRASGPARVRRRLLLGACCGLVFAPSGLGPARGLELVALDVGHGSAILARTPEGGTWIFDSGSRDRLSLARDALGPWLRRWSPDAVTVVLSHGDRDHRGALDWLVERWPIRAWYGAMPVSISARLHPSVPRLDLVSGRAHLARLGPFRADLLRGREVPGNEGSRMLELRYGDSRLLLTGDAEAHGLRETQERAGLRGPYDLLLLPHHGSLTPAVEAFIEHTKPHLTWASCSRPAPISGTLNTLQIPLQSTYAQGALLWQSPYETQVQWVDRVLWPSPYPRTEHP